MAKGKKDRLCEDVLAALAGGMSVSAASRKYKVSRASIYVWKEQNAKRPANFVCKDAKHLKLQGELDSVTAEYEDLLTLAREEIATCQKVIKQLKALLSNSIREFTRTGPGPDPITYEVSYDIS